MVPKTIDIQCKGYVVKADVYEGSDNGAILLSLIGRTSNRSKQHYRQLLPRLAKELGITTVIFDYSGHGDSPFDIEELTPAQHFLEVITVFDWIKEKYPNRKIFVIGSSYGGYMATQLTKYRTFSGLVLRAPAIYRPSDFYTLKKNEDTKATMALRRDSAALTDHPLLARASKYEGDVLLIVHENDEFIPKETTDAYASAFVAETVLVSDITHSLDDATQDQIVSYNQIIFDWLKEKTSAN